MDVHGRPVCFAGFAVRGRVFGFFAACGLFLVFTFSGCAGVVPLKPAQNANDPACADVIVRLPRNVGGKDARETNAQSTGAWGDPTAIVLYCGTAPSKPTTDSCVNVNGVDWVMNSDEAPLYTFTAYGRVPGLRVVLDSEKVSGTDSLVDLSAVAKQLPQNRKCVGVTDKLEIN